MRTHVYYVYILTNPSRKNLYIGITNNLSARLQEHYLNRGNPDTWAGRYYCYKLVYFEVFQYVDKAIAREKEVKAWRREKKVRLINSMNPEWKFLNSQFPYDPKNGRRVGK